MHCRYTKTGTGYLLGIVDLQIDNRFRVVDSTVVGRTKQYCLSLSVSNLCLFKRGKNLTLKTCAPDFSARSMTNYTQKSRARTQSHSLTFLKLGRYENKT